MITKVSDCIKSDALSDLSVSRSSLFRSKMFIKLVRSRTDNQARSNKFPSQISLVVLICLTSAEAEVKKSTKRGIDDYGYPLGFNGGWTSTLKLNSIHTPTNLHDR